MSRNHTQIDQQKSEEGAQLSVFLLPFPVIWSRLSTIFWSFHFLERKREWEREIVERTHYVRLGPSEQCLDVSAVQVDGFPAVSDALAEVLHSQIHRRDVQVSGNPVLVNLLLVVPTHAHHELHDAQRPLIPSAREQMVSLFHFPATFLASLATFLLNECHTQK